MIKMNELAFIWFYNKNLYVYQCKAMYQWISIVCIAYIFFSIKHHLGSDDMSPRIDFIQYSFRKQTSKYIHIIFFFVKSNRESNISNHFKCFITLWKWNEYQLWLSNAHAHVVITILETPKNYHLLLNFLSYVQNKCKL